MKKATTTILIFLYLIANISLLISCGSKELSANPTSPNSIDSSKTQIDMDNDVTSFTTTSGDNPDNTSTPEETNSYEPAIYKSHLGADEELRYNVKEVLVYDHYNSNFFGTEGLQLSSGQINKLLDLLTAAELTEENEGFGETTGGVRKVCKIVTEDEIYYISLNGCLCIWPTGEEPFTIAAGKKMKSYIVDSSLKDYIYNLYSTFCNLRCERNPNAPRYIEPDDELRYNVKEVLFFCTYWYDDRMSSYPDKAVSLPNAQINELLDGLSVLDFSKAPDGSGVLGGIPIVCTIVTDDDRYSIDFNGHEITIWQSEEELFTLEGRKHWKVYSFNGDEPIFEYVKELYNSLRPEGVDPIF